MPPAERISGEKSENQSDTWTARAIYCGEASGKRPPPAVHIHHKFIVIDADTEAPTIYSGSANLSKNSTNYNDENLLEIKSYH